MAADSVSKIAALVKDNKFDKARNVMDQELARIRAIPEKEKQEKARAAFLKSLRDSVKAAGSSMNALLKGDAKQSHELVYDAFGETMEPMYYWLLDFLRENLGYNVEKTADFFAASEASGYFGELGARRTALEKRAVELLGIINTVVKSIINLMWDLKTFDLRLKHYDDLKSPNKALRKTAMEALKGIWLNEVDKAKGNAAIDVLAQNLNFITLRDAFMIVPVQDWYIPDADSAKIAKIKDVADKSVRQMDLTDVVRRILAPRVKDFIDWLYMSARELRQRRAVEKAYLKAQVNALRVYTGWARPYLIATQKLIPAEYRELLQEHKELGLGPAAIPTPFHAMWFYIELLGNKKAEIETLKPPFHKVKMQLKDERLRPNYVLEVRTAFRGSPAMGAVGARGERGTAYTGKSIIKFSSYVMSSEHLELMKENMDNEVLQFIDVMTKESLEALSGDIKKYLEEEPVEKGKKGKLELPFAKVLKDVFGSVRRFNEEIKKIYNSLPKAGVSGKEAWAIARLAAVAEAKAKADCYLLYDKFKKAHKMLTPR